MSHPRIKTLVSIFLLVIGSTELYADENAGTSNIRMTFLPGQTAILWDEGDTAVRRILFSDQPITEANRDQARLLVGDILPGSSNDWFEDPAECQKTKNEPRGWILGPDAKPLGRTGGLFVHTFKSSDPESLYFAVVGDKEKIEPGRNATMKPVRKKLEKIEPIAQSNAVIETMNATPKGLPVMLYLHAHQGFPGLDRTHLIFGDETMGWRDGLPFKFVVRVDKNCIRVEPFDRVWINRRIVAGETASDYYPEYRNIESWWFGTNNQINLPEPDRKDDYVVNYTERWVLYVLDWVIEHYGADRNKVYASGTSMGTGVLRLALNNPDRFAVVDGMVPLLDMTFDEGKPNQNNFKRFKGIWGSPSILIDGKTPIAERTDLIRFVGQHPGELPFVIIRAGRQDYSVFWRRKPDFFRVMNDGRHGLLVGWDNGSHSTAMQKKIEHFPNFRDMSWYVERFALNLSYPAISDCSLNNDPGNGEMNHGDLEGFVNRGIDWKLLADEPDDYRIRLFCTLDEARYPVTLSVTPRRVQRFRLLSGETVQAEITDPAGRVLAEKTAVVDKNGLLTVTGVSLPDKEGVILKLRPKR